MKLKLFKKLFICGAFAYLFFFNVCFVQAGFLKSDVLKQGPDQADIVADAAGYEKATNETLLQVAQTFTNGFLSLIGVILIGYLIYAGYNWMTAQGDEQKIEKAKSTITRAIVGVIIIMAAYAISVFVISELERGALKNEPKEHMQFTPDGFWEGNLEK